MGGETRTKKWEMLGVCVTDQDKDNRQAGLFRPSVELLSRHSLTLLAHAVV